MSRRFARLRSAVRPGLTSPMPWAVGAAALLFALILAGELPYYTGVVAVPVMMATLAPSRVVASPEAPGQGAAALPARDALLAYLDAVHRNAGTPPPALFLLDVASGQGGRALAELATDIRACLRPNDLIARSDGAQLAVVIAPGGPARLEELIQLARRMVAHSSPDASAPPVLRIGICPCTGNAAPAPDRLLDRAAEALQQARDAPPGSIRVASLAGPDDADCRPLEVTLAEDLEMAFCKGQLVPFFQPQVSTDTGQITGAEALVRWQHPRHGVLSPGVFLPTVEAAGELPRLTEHMIQTVLTALAEWDRQGLDMPRVSINFTGADLADPTLPNRLAWMLDAAGIGADRLGVEILETVLSPGDGETIPTVMAELAAMGCAIDLDDFGTGQASITSIRRFCVSRIKIDRSFIRGVDRDPEQQGMVAAIVTMADQLKLEVLAEGVETAGEHARAGELGCAHVQGFGIARPMNAASMPGWLTRHSMSAARAPLPAAMRHLPSVASGDTTARRPLPPGGKTA